MEAAKSAVKEFLGKSGHHDTTVHEKVNPAVTHETIVRTQHENPTTAIDKEVHQHHYHTSVQPVTDTQRLAEQHHHKAAGVEHRVFEHGNAEHDQRRLATEAAQFKDKTTRTEGEHSHSVNPTLTGEHVHHHVHENIQPVVQRQTIEPHVVHTTHPIHEVHHNAAQHHVTSALPTVSLDEFQKNGGTLTGRGERVDGFKGEPRTVGSSLEQERVGGATRQPETVQGASTTTHAKGGVAGGAVPATGAATTAAATTSSGVGNSTSHSTSSTKPTLLEKLNPKIDADNNGKAGFLN